MEKVEYGALNARQQESCNYQKISGVLADYGYTTYRMHDDYHGSDFHAVHINGDVLKVQLKGRVTVHKKYLNKGIHIGFSNDRNVWYLYPHDLIYKLITDRTLGAKLNEARSIIKIPRWLAPILKDFQI